LPVKFPRRSGDLTPHRTGLADFEQASAGAHTRSTDRCRREEYRCQSAARFRKSYLCKNGALSRPDRMHASTVIAGLDPAIPTKVARPCRMIGMAGSSPARTIPEKDRNGL
jgi:hypothetical protein